MIIDKYSIDGQKVGQVELAEAVFGIEPIDTIIYEFIKAANANLRQGTSKVKQRAEVRGGGIKPWRQKGTGRARQGTIRAPQWRGGGIVFGPHPRNYRIDMPKRQKKLAMKCILSLKAKEKSIIVVSDFNVAEGKTKEFVNIMKSFKIDKGVLVYHAENELLKRSVKNIEDIKYNIVNRLNGRDLFYAKKLIITESSLNSINEKYSKGE